MYKSMIIGISLIVTLSYSSNFYLPKSEMSFGIGFGISHGRDDDIDGIKPANARGGTITVDGADGLNSDLNNYRLVLSDMATYKDYSEINRSFGGGLKLDFRGTVFIADNVGVTLVTGLSFLGGFNSEVSGTQRIGNRTDSYLYELSLRNTYIPFNIGMTIKQDIDIITVYAMLAGGPYFNILRGDFIFQNDNQTESKSIRYRLNPGFGFVSALGASVELWENMGLKIELSPTVGFARVKEIIFTNNEGNNPKQHRIVYMPDQPKLPDDKNAFDSNTINYEHGNPRISIANTAFKILFYKAFPQLF